jgi:hypothetical protein
VFLLDGKLLAYLGRTGNHLLTFAPDDPVDEPLWRSKLATALAAIARKGTPVLVGQIDGSPAGGAAIAETLARHGFVHTSRGLLHRAEERHAARP